MFKRKMASKLKSIMKRFGEDIGKLRFGGSVAYTYNPLDYAFAGHEAWLDKFFGEQDAPPAVKQEVKQEREEEGEEDGHRDDDTTTEPVRVKPEPEAPRALPPTLLLSMNPGPYGMTQSGVPFGAPTIVRDWMKIDLGPDGIRAPPVTCPRRPVFGFSSTPLVSSSDDQEANPEEEGKKRKRAKPKTVPSLRQEVSGKRIYVDWAMHTWPVAEDFFKEFYFHTYCPMQFLESSGTNITPDKLSRKERSELYSLCSSYLRQVILVLRPKRIIGIGNFADERLRETLRDWRVELEESSDDQAEQILHLLDSFVIGKLPHPSPRNPQARLMWGNGGVEINKILAQCGVEIPRALPHSIVKHTEEEVEGGDEDEESNTKRPQRKKAKKEPARVSKRKTTRRR